MRPADTSARKCWPTWRPNCRLLMSRDSTNRNITTMAGCWPCIRRAPDVPATIEPWVIDDLDGTPLPTCPDRAAGRMRSRSDRDRDHARLPLAVPVLPKHGDQAAAAHPRGRDDRAAALESYRNTGYNEISLLSLSTSDYPHFERLVERMHETFRRWA